MKTGSLEKKKGHREERNQIPGREEDSSLFI
jgi:hypothetical protein